MMGESPVQLSLSLFGAEAAVSTAVAAETAPQKVGRRFMIKGGFSRGSGSARRVFAVGVIFGGATAAALRQHCDQLQEARLA
jgi:hypothetical protein